MQILVLSNEVRIPACGTADSSERADPGVAQLDFRFRLIGLRVVWWTPDLRRESLGGVHAQRRYVCVLPIRRLLSIERGRDGGAVNQGSTGQPDQQQACLGIGFWPLRFQPVDARCDEACVTTRSLR